MQHEDKKETHLTKEDGVETEGEKRAAITWARRLKRVFDIDITVCEICRGAVKIIACIEDPQVIRQILEHLQKSHSVNQMWIPMNRAPPSVC